MFALFEVLLTVFLLAVIVWAIYRMRHRFAVHPFWSGILILLLVLVLAFVAWIASLAMAPVLGFGGAVKQVFSSDNMLGQYDHFLKLDGDIRAEANQAAANQKALDTFNKSNPPGGSWTIEQQRQSLAAAVSGPVNVCLSNVAQYNNDARALTKEAFKDHNLPDSFPAAACTDPTQLPPGM